MQNFLKGTESILTNLIPRNRFLPGSTLGMLAFLTTSWLGLGCPVQVAEPPVDDDDVADDDDSADDDTTDDDDNADDDDDTQSPPPPESQLLAEGVPECGPISSVTHMSYYEGDSEYTWIFGSTVPDYCEHYREYWDVYVQARAAYDTAYAQAETAPAACQALLDYQTATLTADEPLMPAGSCTAWLQFPGANPGTWSAYAGLMAAVTYPNGSGLLEILELLDDCQGVTDWSSLYDLQMAVISVDRGDAWLVTEGDVIYHDEGDDPLHASAEGLVLETYYSGQTGSLQFDLYASPCGVFVAPE